MPIKKRIELTRTTNKNGGIEDVQIENGDETNNEEEPGFIFENIPEATSLLESRVSFNVSFCNPLGYQRV